MTTTKHRQPLRCQGCGHRTSDLNLRDVTPEPLREAGREAGIGDVVLWVCDDALGCLRRQIKRDTRR